MPRLPTLHARLGGDIQLGTECDDGGRESFRILVLQEMRLPRPELEHRFRQTFFHRIHAAGFTILL